MLGVHDIQIFSVFMLGVHDLQTFCFLFLCWYAILLSVFMLGVHDIIQIFSFLFFF